MKWSAFRVAHADDLVLMAPTMEQLGRKGDECRASLPDKGLKVNAGKSKVIVWSSGGKMIVNSEKWSGGVCGPQEYRQTWFSVHYAKKMDSQVVQWCTW